MTAVALVTTGYTVGAPARGAQRNGYFERLRAVRVASDPSVVWYPVGPGMAGYNEALWAHPGDSQTILIGPDMHISYGSWDGGKTWNSLKDFDGTGDEMKRVVDVDFSRQNPDFGLAIDWNGWLYRTSDRGRRWTKMRELSRSWRYLGIDPYDPDAFAKGWYDEQLGTRLSQLTVDPTDDRIWYIGAGNFWDVKNNHRSLAQPHGKVERYADYGYLLKSVNSGRDWEKITAGLPANLDVGRIIVNPLSPKQLAMATSHGLFLSDDAGLHWHMAGKALPNNLPRDMTIHHDPLNGQVRLFLIDQTAYVPSGQTTAVRGGVFTSDDFGKSWHDIGGNLSFDLSRLDSPLEVERYYQTVGQWLGLSAADARSAYPELPAATLPVFNRIAVNPLNRDEIYLALNKKHDRTFGPGELWRTLDGGRNWQSVLRYGTYWKSAKNGDYWRSRNNPTAPNVEFAHLRHELDKQPELSGNRLLEIGADGTLFVSVDQQTHKSTNKGESWQQIDDIEVDGARSRWIGRGNSDLPGRLMLLDTGVPGRRLFASGEHGIWQTAVASDRLDPEAVVVEQIEGQVHEEGMLSIATMAVHPKDPATIYALSWRQRHVGKVRRTTDGGRTWENIGTLLVAGRDARDDASDFGKGPPGMLPEQNSLTIDPVLPENMYVLVTKNAFTEIYRSNIRTPSVGGYGFMRSRDGGRSWEISNAGLHDGASLRRLVLDPRDPSILYAAANDANGGLFRSTDRGSNWERMAIPAVIRSVNSVSLDRATGAIYIATGSPYDGSIGEGGGWRSADGGVSWERLFEAPLVTQLEASPLDPDLLLLTVYRELRPDPAFVNPGLYLSRDGGRSWAKINTNLNSHEKLIDAKPDPFDKRLLWASGWGSGWNVGVITD
ncbi:WD40/YVTN/BNR-like repeat-containing protein [Sphingopyxis sp. NJF-3]